nr:probable LRR receptor-like serine/threonine-protein kinase At1g51880 [Malus domestica]
MRQREMKISTGFLILLLCASFVHGERQIASKKSQFTYDEVLENTEKFQTKIGKGGFGIVYHGYLKDGTQVAVKILSPSSLQGVREFQTENPSRNLASFIGYCDDTDNLAFIYEYLPNGNLREYLSGLHYLHKGCNPRILHRDVKIANILLSENLDAKIADFSMSMVFPSDNETHVVASVMGIVGYLDPGFTGQPAIIESDDLVHKVEWVNPEFLQRDFTTILFRRILGDCSVDLLRFKQVQFGPILGPLLSAVALLVIVLILFTYDEVLKYTKKFQTEIGKGGFGIVYHGYLRDGTQVAVKILSPSSSQRVREFQTENPSRNLASFIEYCDDTDNLALVYKYMPNGNIREHLSGCNPRILHRDVKIANILLSKNLGAKIADFGLSMVFPSDNETHVVASVMGTVGYLDPEDVQISCS